MFTWVSVVALIFGASQLLQSALKLTFVGRHVTNKAQYVFFFFLLFSIKLGKWKVTVPDCLGKLWLICNI